MLCVWKDGTLGKGMQAQEERQTVSGTRDRSAMTKWGKKTAFQCKYNSGEIKSNKMYKVNLVKNTMFETRHLYQFVN